MKLIDPDVLVKATLSTERVSDRTRKLGPPGKTRKAVIFQLVFHILLPETSP